MFQLLQHFLIILPLIQQALRDHPPGRLRARRLSKPPVDPVKLLPKPFALILYLKIAEIRPLHCFINTIGIVTIHIVRIADAAGKSGLLSGKSAFPSTWIAIP